MLLGGGHLDEAKRGSNNRYFCSQPRLSIIFLCEKHTGNIAKRRLLVNPYGPENFNLNFVIFLGEAEFGKKGGICESPHVGDRYVPNSSPATLQPEILAKFIPKTFFCVTQMRFREKITPRQF